MRSTTRPSPNSTACSPRPPADARAVLIHATGSNFSAGLDLSEIAERNVYEGVLHSRSWHRCFEKIEFGALPVVAVLRGAVVGGGLELAAAAHVRVAERSAFYALPEGQRGIFVGGGGSVRVPRLIGVARMADMMLTGRVYSAPEGVALGFSQYLVDEGAGYSKGLELAHKMAANAPLTNFAVIQALPRIAEADPRIGYVMESLMAAVAQGSDEAKARVRAFLDKRAEKVARPD
jgi:enoyl-CoA hydratase/carnithine racemase